MTPIQIDEEFHSQIPPLAEDERAQLEANIKRDGCREPLVVWNGILLDGHNRHEICERLGLGYRTVVVKLETRSQAADWIDANQLGRRNLSSEASSLLRGRREQRLEKKPGQRTDLTSGQNVQRLTTADLARQHGVDERTIRRDGQFAAAVDKLKLHVPDIERRVMAGEVAGKSAVIQAAREIKTCNTCGRDWLADLQECPYCNKTPAERVAALNDERISKPHVSNNSGNNEWYTPAEYVEAARAAMGGIDLDPASSAIANQTVKAKAFFNSDDNGLSKKWKGRVWMNPPYSQPLVAQFSDAISDKFDAGEIKQACVLVNNATETAWFQRMVSSAAAVCFPRGRVRFLNPQGEPVGAPLQGQAVIYFGANIEGFQSAFASFGPVLLAQELEEAA